MTQLTTQTAASRRAAARSSGPGWFWLAGGSIAVHLLAVAIVLPFVGRMAPKETALDATPIDFVVLPPADTAPKPTAPKPTAPKPIAPSAASIAPAPVQPVHSEASNEISVVPQAPPPIEPAPPIESSVPSPTATPAASAPSPLAPSPPQVSPTPQPAQPQSAVPQSAASQSEATETQPAPPQSDPQSATAPQAPAESSPASPLVETEQISQAPTAESDTPLEHEANPHVATQEELDQLSRSALPSLAGVRFVASLEAAAIPPEQLESPPPDAIAQPTSLVNGISSQTFVADSQSPCMPDPTAAPLIDSGVQVPVQVSTDETGQVLEATPLQPSQNPAYDQLAVCLVKNWSFQPAMSQGQPVPSKALAVLVKIDRG